MIQREIKISGTLAACPGCSGQPKHFHTQGKDLHHLECCPCNVRTPKCSTLQGAVEHWETHDTIDTRRTA